MTEENKDSPEEISAPPVAPSLNPEKGADIIGAAAEKEKRGSAVLGMVEPSAASKEQDSRRGGRGGRGGGRGQGGRGQGGRGQGGRGQGGRGRGRRGQQRQPQEEDSGLIEKVVHINRCAKVVAGGRRFSFSALVVVGDGEGNVGVGYGKAKEVPECIRKGTERAKASMKPINRRNNTIPHPVIGEHDGGRVMLRPATPGTGVIAGGGVRAVLEAAGIKDVLTKSLRSNNPGATVYATLDALKQLRSKEQIYALRRA